MQNKLSFQSDTAKTIYCDAGKFRKRQDRHNTKRQKYILLENLLMKAYNYKQVLILNRFLCHIIFIKILLWKEPEHNVNVQGNINKVKKWKKRPT